VLTHGFAGFCIVVAAVESRLLSLHPDQRAQPFVWTKTAEQILDKALKRQDTSETLH
jgi:hypothetical protein